MSSWNATQYERQPTAAPKKHTLRFDLHLISIFQAGHSGFAQTVRVQTVPGWEAPCDYFTIVGCFSGSKLHSFSSQCKPTEFCKIKKKLKICIRFVAEKSQTFDIFDLWRVRLFLEHVSRVRLRDLFILHCYWRSLWYTATLSYFCTARDLHRTIALVWCQWQKEPLWRLWSCWLWVWPNVGGHYELQIRGFSCL